MNKYRFLWLLLMIMAIASTSSAQQASPNRPKPTINGPRLAAESAAQTTILKRCSEVAPDAEFLIPRVINSVAGQKQAARERMPTNQRGLSILGG